MSKIKTKAGKKLGGKPKVAQLPSSGSKAWKAVQKATAAIRKGVHSLGANEALIIRRKGVGHFTVRKVPTGPGVPEIVEDVAERHAHAAPSGRGELTEDEAKALDAGGFDRTPLPRDGEDPVALAAAEYAKLRDESLSTAEAGRRLTVKDSRIRQRLSGKAPTLFGLKVDGGDWRIPTFQFVGNARVPGIEKVIPRLRAGLNPVSVVRWFNAPNSDLPADGDEERSLSPLEWLRMGHDPSVVAELAGDL